MKMYENHKNKNEDEFLVNITLSANTDFFTSISKIRASRIIFNNILLAPYKSFELCASNILVVDFFKFF